MGNMDTPNLMYHVAPRSARESIMANGLSNGDYVHLSDADSVLNWNTKNQPPVEQDKWEVGVDGLDLEHGYNQYEPGWSRYFGAIPPNRLRLLTDERTAGWGEKPSWGAQPSWGGGPSPRSENEFWDSLEDFESDELCPACNRPMREHMQACKSVAPAPLWAEKPQWNPEPRWGTVAGTLPPNMEIRNAGGDAIDRYQYNDVLGAYVDGKPVGMIEVGLFKHPTWGNEATVHHIQVAPEYRRQGVATALFNYANMTYQKEYGPLQHTLQTNDGAAWVQSLPGENPDLGPKTADFIGDAYPGEEHVEENANLGLDDSPDYTNEAFEDPELHMGERHWVCTGDYVMVADESFHDMMQEMGVSANNPRAYGSVDLFYNYEAMFSITRSNISLHLLERLLKKYCGNNQLKFEGLLRADGTPYDEKMSKVATELPGGSVPPEPGTIPIPPNHVRLYHYTGAPEGTLDQEGIKMQNAKGESYGEPNRVWASARKPSDGHRYAEFSMPHDDPRWDIGKFTPGINYNYPDEPGEIPEEDWANYLMSRGQDVTFMGDIRPEEILAMHEPWHETLRSLQDMPEESLPYWLDEPGSAERFPNEYRAWQEYKKAKGLPHEGSVRLGEAPGVGRNNPGEKIWRINWDGENQPVDYYGEQNGEMNENAPNDAMLCPHCGEFCNSFGDFLVHEDRVHDNGLGIPDSAQPVVDMDDPMPAHFNTNPGPGTDKTIDRAV